MKKTALLALLLVIVMALTSCKYYIYTPRDELFTPGAYTHTVTGHNGTVTVKTTLDKNRVTAIEVLAHEESASIGDSAMQQVARSIIDRQSFEVDTVSGATYSSVALLQAVSLAVRDAGGDAPDITMDMFAPPEPEPEDEPGGFPAPPFNPGEYSSSSLGFGGMVTVTVTVDENAILSVVADGPSETDGIGSRAIDELPAALLEAGHNQVDGVSGATFTSSAIKSAFTKAMEQTK